MRFMLHWYRRLSHTHTQSHTFNGPMSGTTQVSRYQKGKTDLDFTGATDSEWQWHQLGHMQVCTSLQTDNHASTSLLSFLQARCPSCHPTNSVKVPSVLWVAFSTEGYHCEQKQPSWFKYSSNSSCPCTHVLHIIVNCPLNPYSPYGRIAAL